MGRTLPASPEHHLEMVIWGVFALIFLATLGLRVDLGLLSDP
ncbi:MAG TPA: hypothetical protein VGV63_01945 [Acidimicrobiales bacterium]|nr:hypothetical protein [Acidimicrobiales bacterium]